MRNQSNAGVKAQWFVMATRSEGNFFDLVVKYIYIGAILMTQLIVSIK